MHRISKFVVAGVSSLLLASIALADPAAKPAKPQMTTQVAPKPPVAANPPVADKDMKAVLDAHVALGAKPLETLTPDAARAQPTPADAVKAVLTKKKKGKEPAPEAVAKVEDKEYANAAGTKLPLRVYTPKGKGPFPVIVYYHGGGWVIADLDVYDATPRALANAAGAIVVSVEYRKGPEAKFPAAHDDSFAAYKWVLANAASFNGNPERIAVAGESAGGNLAMNTAIRARDEKVGAIAHMLLVYPVAGKDMTTASYVTNANAAPLSKAGMEWFVKHAFARPTDAADKRIDLVSRTDLAGLPPAMVITAEIDPLRSEGQMLAKNLMSAGVKVQALDYKGVAHEFFGMGPAVKKAKQAQQKAGAALKAAFKAKAVAAK